PITILVESGHVIRYIGVRAPSVTSPVHCFGKEALLANESMLGKRVRLEEEPLLLRSSDGAWTRYVFFEDDTPAPPAPSPEMSPAQGTPSPAAPPGESERTEPREIFVNERFLEGGFGFPVVSQDMKYGERMLAAARYAGAIGKGLWQRCQIQEQDGQNSVNITTQILDTCLIKGVTTVKQEKIYRTPECPAYRQTIPITAEGGAWFCAEDIAERNGYVLAPDCPADT
ncbi:MAG: hypothetical protein ACRD4B_08155, partial [Acidobacteriota bacterium]